MIWFIHEGSPQKVNKTGMLPKIHKQNREEENPTGSALFWRQDEAVYVPGRPTYARDITNVSTLLLCSNLVNNQLNTANLFQIQARTCCAMMCHRVLELKYPRHPTKALLGIPVKQGDLLQCRLGSRVRQVSEMTTKDRQTNWLPTGVLPLQLRPPKETSACIFSFRDFYAALHLILPLIWKGKRTAPL